MTGSTPARSRRGVPSSELGGPQLDPAITLWDDATDPRAISRGFDAEGTPKRRVDLVVDGVPVALCHDRRTAAKAGAESTGHGFGGDYRGHRRPTSSWPPGHGRPEELVASVERGLLVTEFWYTRILDPKTQVVTGLTRNGTFLIEGGRVVGGVPNLRFTQSYVDALRPGNVLGVGDDARLFDGALSRPDAAPGVVELHRGRQGISRRAPGRLAPRPPGNRCAGGQPAGSRRTRAPAGAKPATVPNRWASSPRTSSGSGPPPTSWPWPASTSPSGGWAGGGRGCARSTPRRARRSPSTPRKGCTTASAAARRRRHHLRPRDRAPRLRRGGRAPGGPGRDQVRHDTAAVSEDRQRRARLVEVDGEGGGVVPPAPARRARCRPGPGLPPLRVATTARWSATYRLGWAPDGWDELCRALRVPEDVLRDTGLGFLNKLGRQQDFFRARVLFPIFDVRGDPVAFGGRRLRAGAGTRAPSTATRPRPRCTPRARSSTG